VCGNRKQILPPDWVKQSGWPHCLLCSEQSDHKTTLYLTYGSYVPKLHIHVIYLPSLLFSLVTDSIIRWTIKQEREERKITALDLRNPNQTLSHYFKISVNKWRMLYHVLQNAAASITMRMWIHSIQFSSLSSLNGNMWWDREVVMFLYLIYDVS
jgi:hypothetical protein